VFTVPCDALGYCNPGKTKDGARRLPPAKLAALRFRDLGADAPRCLYLGKNWPGWSEPHR
jgi:hypothetical protein